MRAAKKGALFGRLSPFVAPNSCRAATDSQSALSSWSRAPTTTDPWPLDLTPVRPHNAPRVYRLLDF